MLILFPSRTTRTWRCWDPDASLVSEKVAQQFNATLEEVSAGSDPWFIAVGFHKPHLPFIGDPRTFLYCAPPPFARNYSFSLFLSLSLFSNIYPLRKISSVIGGGCYCEN